MAEQTFKNKNKKNIYKERLNIFRATYMQRILNYNKRKGIMSSLWLVKFIYTVKNASEVPYQPHR
jgi:hypothetical protein